MKFKVKRKYLTFDEKIKRAKEFNLFENENINVNDFANQEVYDEYVDFKCTNCGIEHEIEADIVFEMFDPEFEDYPKLQCNDCEEGTLIPIDIYDHLLKNK